MLANKIVLSALVLITFIHGKTEIFTLHQADGAQAIVIFAPFEKVPVDVSSDFMKRVFDVPKIIDYARIQQLPVILVVPENIEGTTPLADEAPQIESARVAMTHASVAFRFEKLGNVDVRILCIPNEISDSGAVRQFISLSASMEFSEDDAPKEDQMERRILKASTMIPCKSEAGAVLRPLIKSFDSDSQVTHIVPDLPAVCSRQHRYVITGGAGFIGIHLAERLLKAGHQVIALDNFTCCNPANLNKVSDNQNFFFFNHDVTKKYTIDGPVHGIAHLASVPSPAYYYALPKETLSTGLYGTLYSLELAYEKGARFLLASTSEVYGDPDVNPQVETYPGKVSTVGKRSQYDQSKRGAETLVKVFTQQYPVDVRIVRIFNTYGPHMMIGDGRVVTNFIKASLEHQSLQLYGDGLQTRSFGYIDDTVEGIMRLFLSQDFDESVPLEERVFNIGNQDEFTVKDLSEKVVRLSQQELGYTPEVMTIPQFDKTDPMQRRPNLSRAFSKFGYVPKVALDEGLSKTLAFFRQQTSNLRLSA